MDKDQWEEIKADQRKAEDEARADITNLGKLLGRALVATLQEGQRVTLGNPSPSRLERNRVRTAQTDEAWEALAVAIVDFAVKD